MFGVVLGAFPTPRLQVVFGVPLPAVDRRALAQLVDDAVGEEFDLEFKGQNYDSSEKGRQELAKDVAAMTERGGVIVIGIAERRPNSPMQLLDIDISDRAARTIRQVVAKRIMPMPQFDLVPVPSATPDRGQWLVVVPASPSHPHVVSHPGNPGLFYYVRHGTTTRELTESEVADRYRARFRMAREARSRTATVLAEGVTRLSLGGRPWLAMALVPDRPGRVDITRLELERHRRWAEVWQSSMNSRLDLVATRAQTVGFRRLIISRGMQWHGTSDWGHCEVHTDGAGFVASTVGEAFEHTQPRPATNQQIGERDHIIDQGVLAHTVIAMLSLLSAQAVEFAGASGDATVVASLVPAGDADGRVDRRPIRLVEWRSAGPRIVPGSRQVDGPSESWHTAPLLMLVASGTELVAAAHGIISDLVSEFGQAEWTGTTAEGQVNPDGFGTWEVDLVRQWARAKGVELTQSQ